MIDTASRETVNYTVCKFMSYLELAIVSVGIHTLIDLFKEMIGAECS